MATAGTKLHLSDRSDVSAVLDSSNVAASKTSNLGVFGVRRWLFVFADLCGLCAGASLSLLFRFHGMQLHTVNAATLLGAHLGIVLLYAVLVVLLSHAQGLYSMYQAASARREVLAVVKSVFLATLLVTASIYASGSKDVSRFVVGFTATFSIVAMCAWRQVRRRVLYRAVADGLTCHNVLIIGTDSMAQTLRDHLASHRQLGFVVLGLLSASNRDRFATESPSEDVIGTVADLPTLCRTHFVDEIIICAQQRHIVKSVIAKAREYGVGVRVIPDLYDGMAWGAHLDYLGAFPTLAIVHRDIPAIELKFKRLLDLVTATIGLTLLSPLMLLLAILIKLDSRGPVFYKSQRVGKKGRIFACYKFRTMVTDAEQQKAKLQHLNERDGILFKIRNDPRITRVGRFLRKYSLDELAQLWNVFKGDMSLVGPRPPLASEVKQYELEYYRRLEVAPGITGLWQVEGRTSPSFKDYISLDLSYVENWSFGLDLKILARTLGVVVAGTGS